MMEVGRVCFKIVGRESGKPCVIIKKLDGNFVLIDGLVRRKKCNVKHLEPTIKKVSVSEKSSKEDVLKKLVELEIVSQEEVNKFLSKNPKEVKKEKPVKKRKVGEPGKKQQRKEKKKEDKKQEKSKSSTDKKEKTKSEKKQ